MTQRAGAYALEVGWQPSSVQSLKPWLRAGYNYGSGDDNASDQTHGTFFQVLPTPRVYARLPFFNMMNSRDSFGELIVRPNGQSGLATLYDVGGDYGITSHLAVSAYYGRASSQAVAQTIYPTGTNVHLGYLELLVRF